MWWQLWLTVLSVPTDLQSKNVLYYHILRLNLVCILLTHMKIFLPSYTLPPLKPLTLLSLSSHLLLLLSCRCPLDPQHYSHFVILSPCWGCSFNPTQHTHTHTEVQCSSRLSAEPLSLHLLWPQPALKARTHPYKATVMWRMELEDCDVSLLVGVLK